MTKRTMFAGKIFSVVWEEHSLSSGEVMVYETVEAPDVVRVYPILDDQMLLIREHRPELGGRIVRTVSGRIERGEQPVEAALRELREELGVLASGGTVFATSRPIIKVLSTVHHVLVRPERMVSTALEAGEDIEPFAVSMDRIEDIVWAGDVVEDVIALQLLRLARSRSFAGNAAGGGRHI